MYPRECQRALPGGHEPPFENLLDRLSRYQYPLKHIAVPSQYVVRRRMVGILTPHIWVIRS